jgi:hypothetical protein
MSVQAIFFPPLPGESRDPFINRPSARAEFDKVESLLLFVMAGLDPAIS